MTKQKTILLIIILILFGGNVFLGAKYFAVQKELKETKAMLEIQDEQKINEKVLDFTKLFIAEVLKSEDEIDFETRLTLENSVRELNDDEILNQWRKFTASETEIEAQEEVKNLLELLINTVSK